MANNRAPSSRTTHSKTLAELDNYKLLVENVEDYAIFMLDKNGVVMTWNKGAQKNKGYTADEIIGKHFSTFYLQDDIDSHKPERELAIATKVGRVEDEDWRVRKDGSRFWANVVITALFNDDGELVGFAKVTRDLTERKQHEDELRQANALLRRQQQELKALNESKNEFISLASHQLRTPATGVKQLLGILIEGFEGAVEERHLELIRKAYEANDRQISIVNSLLQVAQLDAGKVVLKKTAVDVGQLLKDIIDEQNDTIRGRSQSVVFSSPTKPVYSYADPKYLRMALENIIDNASKYTPEGGKITASVLKHDRETQISVSDTGVGIPPELLSELFQKFKRIPNELSQKVSGSGLGLYWVRQVITLHGGTIEVTSKPEHGTTFLIRLPQDETDA